MYRPCLRYPSFLFSGVSQRAFTLVEVVLAIGVISFSLIAILGLISVSLKNAREANLRESLTMATDRISSLYQGENFTNALALAKTANAYYFDDSGLPMATSAGAFFQCSVTNVTPTADSYFFQSAVTGLPSGSAPINYLGVLQLQVRWPSPSYTSTNSSLISILNCH